MRVYVALRIAVRQLLSRKSIVSTLPLLVLLLTATNLHAQVEYVDPTIGNVGILLEPTRPAVYLPNSMIRMYPMRKDALDDRIHSFPLTIRSHRNGELFSIMPGDGDPAAYDQETTTPYYYSSRLRDLRHRYRVHLHRALRLLPLHLSQQQRQPRRLLTGSPEPCSFATATSSKAKSSSTA